jgi:hypothetical protein
MAGRYDKEVAVTRCVATAERECAGEIDPDKILRQDRPNGGNEFRE